jgi:hypothetical protein
METSFWPGLLPVVNSAKGTKRAGNSTRRLSGMVIRSGAGFGRCAGMVVSMEVCKDFFGLVYLVSAPVMMNGSAWHTTILTCMANTKEKRKNVILEEAEGTLPSYFFMEEISQLFNISILCTWNSSALLSSWLASNTFSRLNPPVANSSSTHLDLRNPSRHFSISSFLRLFRIAEPSRLQEVDSPST